MRDYPPSPHNILDLNRIHHDLEELFYFHQLSLLEADLNTAKAFLKKYEDVLLNHMEEEEEILLPIYRKRAVPERGGDADIFIQEHKKIIEWLGRLRLRFSRLDIHGKDKKNLILLLDDEAHFKKYVGHHSQREEHILYPALGRVIDEKETADLLRLLTFSSEENKSSV